jgi:hypothetical protein
MMRVFFALLFFIHCSLATFAQVVSGIVYDARTNEPIESASVYFSGTMVGTRTDVKGNFRMDIRGNANKPLTVSFMGYQTETLTELSPDKPLVVMMIPKSLILGEVVVSAKVNPWIRKGYLKTFRNEFLGMTPNGKSCEIQNENDINFSYDQESNMLKAFCSKPLLIKNKALGYSITYFLDKFEHNLDQKTTFYDGSILFSEDMESDTLNREDFIRNRKKTYLGSKMHFFRLLYANKLASSKFTVQKTGGDYLDYNKLVMQGDDAMSKGKTDVKYLKPLEHVFIFYYSKRSDYVFDKEDVFIEKSGYCDVGLTWGGNMARIRIGDTLPYDYEYE